MSSSLLETAAAPLRPLGTPLRPLGRMAEAGESLALAQLLRWTWRPASEAFGAGTAPIQRMQIQALRGLLEAGMRLMPAQHGVRVRPECIAAAHQADGRPDDLRGEWSVPRDPLPDAALLYLHGGGFVFGSARTHRMLAGPLAADSGLAVIAPSYRLAPEHPYPAALDDATAAFDFLIARGVPAHRIVVAGDSAGGHLAVALVARLNAAGRAGPGGVLLLSPWLDLEGADARLADRRARDPFVSPKTAARLALLYAREHPRTAGADAASVPCLIQVGGRETLAGDARRFADEVNGAGGDCRFERWPGQIHVFHALHPWVPAARSALRGAARFARECVDPSD